MHYFAVLNCSFVILVNFYFFNYACILLLGQHTGLVPAVLLSLSKDFIIIIIIFNVSNSIYVSNSTNMCNSFNVSNNGSELSDLSFTCSDEVLQILMFGVEILHLDNI